MMLAEQSGLCQIAALCLGHIKESNGEQSDLMIAPSSMGSRRCQHVTSVRLRFIGVQSFGGRLHR